MWRKGHSCKQKCKLVLLLWKTMWRFLKKKTKPKNRITMWPSHSTSVYLSEKIMKTLIWKDTCTPVFTAELFSIAKIWKQLKCPLMNDKNMWYISQMAQTVKSLPAMWVQSLSQENPLEKWIASHSSILAMDREA